MSSPNKSEPTIFEDFRKLLDNSQRRRYSVLQLLFILAAVVQVVSVASIAPFIGVLSNVALIHENPLLSQLYTYGAFDSERSFLIAFASLLMVTIFVGNLVPTYIGYASWSFVRKLGVEIQADVYRGYIYGDLSRAARSDSAQMTNAVVQGVNRLVYNVVLPLLSLISSGLIVLLIVIGLILFDPIAALVASFVVGGGYFIIFTFSKKRLSRAGKSVWMSLQARQRLMAESLRGIKEIRLAGMESTYEGRLRNLTDQALKGEADVGLFSDLPRYALETIALCALLGLGIFLLFRNDDWSSIVAILSVYAMAGYRLLPAAQVVFKSAATVRGNLEVVRDMTEATLYGRSLSIPDRGSVMHYSTHQPIVVDNLSFRYPDEPQDVLRGISVTIQRNSVTALVGESGAGKSTLADLLLGLFPPSSGDITVNGASIFSNSRSWQRSVCLVSQSVFLFDDTIEANIVFGSSESVDRRRLERAVQLASAETFISQLPGGLSCTVGDSGGRLSGGQRQRIGIARALYNDADIIVLDEPTSALDSLSEREVIGAIDSLRGKKTVILITHRTAPLMIADEVLVLESGRLVGKGTFSDLSTQCAAFQRLLATEHSSSTVSDSETPNRQRQ